MERWQLKGKGEEHEVQEANVRGRQEAYSPAGWDPVPEATPDRSLKALVLR